MPTQQGITTYSTDEPTYGFSAATTEFDDALIERGIVTLEQALVANGATPEQAAVLAHQKRHGTTSPVSPEPEVLAKQSNPKTPRKNDDDGDKDSETEDDDDEEFLADDDENDFMERYRRERLVEIQQQQAQQRLKHGRSYFGEAIPISRTEWKHHVNDGSQNGVWVVVCLTSSSSLQRTGCVERAVKELAGSYPTTKFVLIPSHHAIPNWPESNLPSLFLYHDGVMQHQLIQLPCDMTTRALEERLSKLSVLLG